MLNEMPWIRYLDWSIWGIQMVIPFGQPFLRYWYVTASDSALKSPQFPRIRLRFPRVSLLGSEAGMSTNARTFVVENLEHPTIHGFSFGFSGRKRYMGMFLEVIPYVVLDASSSMPGIIFSVC